MAINNPYIPGDPFSYDLKWLVRRIKELALTLENFAEEIPDDDHIKQLIQSMIDGGEINTMLLKEIGIFNVKDYGAVGDALTDDRQAILDAYADAVEAQGVLYFPDGKYLISAGIELPDPVNVLMKGYIYYPLTGTAVTLGRSGESYNYAHQNWNIRGISAVNSGSEGLRIRNANSCHILFDDILLFEKCVVLDGDGAGLQNNIFTIGTIGNFTTGLQLTSQNDGWCNENLFIGGRFFAPLGHSWTTTAIEITSQIEGRLCNNNVFLKPNVETNNVGIRFDRAIRNHVIDMRAENVSQAVEITRDACQGNIVKVGFGNLNETEYSGVNKLEGAYIRGNLEQNVWRVFDFADLAKNACCNASVGSIKDVYGANDYEPGVNNPDYRYTLTDGALTLPASRVLCGMFDVKSPKKGRMLYIEADIIAGAVRGIVSFFDADGNNITTEPVYFTEQGWAPQAIFSATTFRTSVGVDPAVITIPENATRIFAGVQAYQSIVIKGFRVMTNANVSKSEHLPTITNIPTVNGSMVGQVAYGTGGQVWVWNGSAWKTVTTA